MLRFFLIFALWSLVFASTSACKGCLHLDDLNFDKIIPRFQAVLVKFDVAYPYGDKHEVFAKLAEELGPNKDLIFAEVGVKDYGDKDNENLALKYGITKDDLPAIRLFVLNRPTSPFEHSKDADWSLDGLRNLVRDNTDIYIGLPGCLEAFDKKAAVFMNSNSPDKSEVLREAETEIERIEQERDKESASFYAKVMQKVIDSGAEFIRTESERLGKIVRGGKVKEDKKQELGNRINILRSFLVKRDEL